MMPYFACHRNAADDGRWLQFGRFWITYKFYNGLTGLSIGYMDAWTFDVSFDYFAKK